jgi:hypothetical protein
MFTPAKAKTLPSSGRQVRFWVIAERKMMLDQKVISVMNPKALNNEPLVCFKTTLACLPDEGGICAKWYKAIRHSVFTNTVAVALVQTITKSKCPTLC